VEPLSALVVATALLAAAMGIAIQSIREILTPHHTPAAFTLVILVGVVVTKELMFRVLIRTGGKTYEYPAHFGGANIRMEFPAPGTPRKGWPRSARGQSENSVV